MRLIMASAPNRHRWMLGLGLAAVSRPDPVIVLRLRRSCVGAGAGAPHPVARPDAERPHGIPTLERGNERD